MSGLLPSRGETIAPLAQRIEVTSRQQQLDAERLLEATRRAVEIVKQQQTRRERKSFFRRLAEKKGSPRIDWEVVWFMRKPL